MNKSRRILFNLAFCVGMVALIGFRPNPNIPKGPVVDAGFRVPAEAKQRGISWVGSRPVGSEHMAPLPKLGANWIVQTPFAWQEGHDSPALHFSTEGYLWGESDTGLIATHQLAKQAGLKVLLKPHIWITRAQAGKWRSDIAMKDGADWQTWWRQYRAFMLHHARLAEQEGMAALSVGTELAATVTSHEHEWRELIADIRAVYHGKLTYAANWYDEYERVPFWDDLDWIGIQAYFPLAQTEQHQLDDLIAGWQPHLEQMARVARRFGKPVVLTEIGYRATSDAAIEPWRWPSRGVAADESGLATQALCYEAFFQAVWHQPWVAGAYIWKWHPHINDSRRPPSEGFSPQQKPAVEVLKRYYQQP